MIKRLLTMVLNILLEIFNYCIKNQVVPKVWKQGLMYPISKKSIFSGNLVQTRPITLIEHRRKLFTKILTINLNKILSKLEVLSPQNNAALPQTLTAQPIQ